MSCCRLGWLSLLAACGAAPVVEPVESAPPPVTGTSSLTIVDASLRARAQLLFAKALDDNVAIATLRDLCTVAPKRLSGSPGAEAAVRWSIDQMLGMGLQNVHAEPVLVPCWVRGVESARVVGDGRELRITALGGSIGTGAQGVTAELLEVRSFEQLRELGDRARGKIVFFNRPMPRALRRTGQAYGEAVPQRSNGAIEAGKAGAVAALVRSMTTTIDQWPHTGAMRYEDGVPMVPAAAVCTEDAELLAARLKQGAVRVQLQLGCETRPDVMSANVVGELRGSSRADGIVVIGAHLDAWDLGTGAHDDGAGCVHVLEALRLLQACGIQPKRTIRAVLFMNEENGLRGAEAYARAHAAERHVAAIESDSGGFTPQGFTCSLSGEAAEAVRAQFRPLDEFGAGIFLAGGGAGGADIAPLGAQGAALFGLMVDGQRYFDYHHTAVDTIDAVHERELAMGAATLAYAASVLADR
ncbi:MAG: M20/M25/M40 family metallo-hydrolase [Planctomycetes bacterium]|nr:M20/M25/M40 family metallo-hydrolase [Planctomycetota bacterium]